MNSKRFLILFLVCVIPVILNAQIGQEWLVKYDGPAPSQDQPFDMVVDGDGYVYVTGTGINQDVNDLDMITVKYGPEGSEIWKSFYTASIIGHDQGNAIAVDASGNVYVAGFTYQNPSATEQDLLVVKYDSDGNQLWADTYTSTSIPNLNEYATSIEISSTGHIYVGGSVNEFGAQFAGTKFTVLKYTVDGSRLWVSNYFRYPDGSGDDFLLDMVVDLQGNVYVTGYSEDFLISYDDYCTVKFSSDGNILWAKFYNGTNPGPGIPATDQASDIEIDIAGNIYVTGYSNGGEQTGIDYATIKYNSSGNMQWAARYDNGFGSLQNDDYATSLKVDVEGNVYVTGFSEQQGGTYNDYLTLKYDGNGNELWEQRYNGMLGNHDNAYKIALDLEGSVYVSGSTVISAVEKDIGIIKYNSNGDSVWFVTQDPRNSIVEYPTGGLYVDDDKNIYVSAVESFSSTSNIMTIKFSEGATDIKYTNKLNPDQFELKQNYPNPFNPNTKIKYSIPQTSRVIIKVFDILGNEIRTLVNREKKPGIHSVNFNGTNFTSGVYFFTITAGKFSETRKMVLIK